MADDDVNLDPTLSMPSDSTIEETSSSADNSGGEGLQFNAQEVAAILARPAPASITGQPQTKSSDIISDENVKKTIDWYEKEQKYGDRPLEAAALGAGSSLTFTGLERALKKTGLVSEETLREIAERNESADLFGQVAGAIVPSLLTGGAAIPEETAAIGLKAAARGAVKFSAPALIEQAGLAAEKGLAKTLGTAAAEVGNKRLVSEIVKKSIEKSAGSLVEGSAWGANQLLREDALGQAELNAENLLAHVGEGALLGGALGAALVPGGAIMSDIGAGLSKKLSKVGESIFDPVRDSAKLLGMTSAQVAKFQERNPRFLEELPDWLKGRLKLELKDSSESLLSKLNNVEKAAATGIDDSIVALDKAAAEKGLQLGPGVYDDVARQLDEKFVAPNAELRSMDSHSGKAKELIEDFRAKAAKHRLEGTVPDLAELRNMRKKMDELAKAFYKSADAGSAAKAGFTARDAFNQTMRKWADQVDPALAQTFKDFNKDYHYAATLGSRLNAKNEKAAEFVGIKDLLLGAAGFEIGDAIDGDSGGLKFAGLGLAGARKFLNSDLKRKMVILSQVEKGQQRVASRMASSITNFFTTASKPAKLSSLNVLVKSALARAPGEEPPKNRQAAFKNIQQNVVELAADPLKMQDRIAKSTHVLAYGAPETARSMGETMQRAVTFLAAKAPKDAREAAYNHFEPEYQPSTMELATFERYMQVVDNPLSILKDLESGALTRDHVEALKNVYPNMYNQVRVQALKEAQNNTKLTYNKRLQLGILLDIPADSSLSPTFVMQMQQNFVPPEQRQVGAMGGAQPASNGTQAPVVSPTQGGASKLQGASRQMTGAQRVAATGSSES